MRTRRYCQSLPVVLLAFAAPAHAADRLSLPDAAARTRTEALLDSIDAKLRHASSATLTLESWCADHHMASPARIVVEHDKGPPKPATLLQRRRLAVPHGVAVHYRKVRLVCGDHVLSEAENWYVPSRLTPAMNATLNDSDAPYGKVIRPLSPRRQTLADIRNWSPSASSASSPCDTTAFSHDALVISGKGQPLALVSEHYKLELICGIDAEE